MDVASENKIMGRLDEGRSIGIEDVMKSCKINLTDAFKYLKELLNRGIIVEKGDGRFVKINVATVETTPNADEIEEDAVLTEEDLKEKLKDVDITLLYILEYILTHPNQTMQTIVKKYGDVLTKRGIESGIKCELITKNGDQLVSVINLEQLAKLKELYKNNTRR